MLEITVENLETHSVFRPQGDVDAYTVAQFRGDLNDLCDVPKLLIDLNEVPFMDSAGLGALIGGIRRIRDAQGAVVVACGRETLSRLLHTTGFDRIVPVAASLEDAVELLLNPDPEQPTAV